MVHCALLISLLISIVTVLVYSANGAKHSNGGRTKASLGILSGQDGVYYNSAADTVGLWCSNDDIAQVSRWRELQLQHNGLESL